MNKILSILALFISISVLAQTPENNKEKDSTKSNKKDIGLPLKAERKININ